MASDNHRNFASASRLILCLAVLAALKAAGCSEPEHTSSPATLRRGSVETAQELTLPTGRSAQRGQFSWQVAPTSVGTAVEIPLGKKCSGCGHEVGLGARVGQRCPHCGGVWSFERKVYVNRP